MMGVSSDVIIEQGNDDDIPEGPCVYVTIYSTQINHHPHHCTTFFTHPDKLSLACDRPSISVQCYGARTCSLYPMGVIETSDVPSPEWNEANLMKLA